MREFTVSISIRPKKYLVWLLVTGLLVGGTAALFNTDTGKGVMAGIIAYVLEKKSGFEFEIEGLDIDIGELKVSMAGVTLRDGDVDWLKAENIRMNWDYENLTGISCSMQSFKSGPVTVSALPGKSYTILNNLQKALFTSSLSIDRLSIPSVTFDSRVFGRELKVNLQGDCDAAGRSRNYGVVGQNEKLIGEIRLQNFNDYREKLMASEAEQGEIPPSIQAYARLSEEKGGILSRYLGLSDASPMYVEAVVPFRYRGVKDAFIRLETSVSSQLSFSGYVDGSGYVDYSGDLTMNGDLRIRDFVIPAKHYLFDVEFRPNADWTMIDSVGAYLASEDKSEELFVMGGVALWNGQYDLDFKANLPLSSPLWQGKTAGLKSEKRSFISGSVKGLFANPKFRLDTAVYDAEFGAYRAKQLDLSVGIKNYFDWRAGSAATVSASVSGLQRKPEGSGDWLGFPDLHASLRVEHSLPGRDIWKIDAFELAMEGNRLSLTGKYDRQTGRIDVRHDLQIGRLPQWMAGRFRLPAPLTASGYVSGNLDDKLSSNALIAEMQTAMPGIDGMPLFIGPSPKFDITLTYDDASGYLDLSAERFVFDGISGDLSGRADLNDGLISLQGHFASLTDAFNQGSVPEMLAGEFHLAGSVGAATLSAQASGIGITPAGETIEDLRFDISASGPVDRLNGEITAAYDRGGVPVKVRSPVELGLLYVRLDRPDALPLLKYRPSEIPDK